MQHENVVATIGNTPLIRLSNVTEGIVPATVYAKVEAFNPGQSAKDRVARYMIEQAEASGQLKPGEAQQALTAGGAWNVTVGKQMNRLDAGQALAHLSGLR